MIHTDVDLPEVSDDPVSELRNTGIPEVQQKKRGREYLLLKEDVIDLKFCQQDLKFC